MTGTAMALCAAISIDNQGDQAPEWLHLLPAGEARTVDGRGPYKTLDAKALMAASMAGGKLVLDINHSTDVAAPRGEPSPAQAWITELQSRDDGIWGKADWIDPQAAPWKRYRGVSPVIGHLADGTVTAIMRASLTNTPNLAGLQSLHSQEKSNMDLLAKLVKALGLASDADDAAVIAAIKKLKDGGDPKVALNAALAPIAKVVGVAEDADAATVLAGVQRFAGADNDRVVALQSELAGVTTSLNTLRDQTAKDKATAYVDAAITSGRVGLKPVRDEYISMHMADPARVEKLVSAMPILAPGKQQITAVIPAEGAPENPALLSQQAAAYQKKMADSGTTIDFATAVRAVADGKDKA